MAEPLQWSNQETAWLGSHREPGCRLVHAALAAFRQRHADTATHMERVGELAERLGTALGWDAESARNLRWAGALHDLGKIGLPDQLLHKPGRLTPDEFELIREHSEIGADILGSSSRPEFELAAEVALHHHERWDGSGYPIGLAGLDIPISARIVAVVDVYDAMSQARVYRVALPKPLVIRLMKEESGKRFDPWVLDCFLDMIQEGKSSSLSLVPVLDPVS